MAVAQTAKASVKQKRLRAASDEDSATRQRLIDAAVACILEQGYYRASSNEIARRAGLTWGVIQYHFGTRERLMLAVFEDACRRMVDAMRNARVEGETTEERLRSYFDVLRDIYGRREHLAYVQINLNLVRDPDTSRETTNALKRLRHQLIEENIWPECTSPEHDRLVFEAFRGYILAQLVQASSWAGAFPEDRADFERVADELIRSLAAHIDAAGRSRA